MCSKTTRSNRSMKRKTKPKPPRKTRSLQRDFSPPGSTESTHQLNLFPLHPEEDNSVECFFDSTETTSAATLNGLVWGVSSEEDSLSPSLTYAYSEESSLLERSALRGGRNKERDLSEEKWVCYEEVTSCVPKYRMKNEGRLLLSLKLDYEEIMNAWSDKGPLYIDGGGGEGSQIVPDVLHDVLLQDISNAFLDIGNVPLLRVPDDGSSVMEGMDGKLWKLGAREAGVLRYKKKRQNRLFSKRIRYEVRKLNAEKRPRMKGRFVKRS